VKKLLTIVLIIFLYLPFIIQSGYIINYVINIESITKNYCVNKDKPQLHCNGNCQLSKKLNTTNTNESTSIPNIESLFLSFYEEIFTINFQNGFIIKLNLNVFKNINFSNFIISIITPPPQIL
jgi:hypothetical protein